MRRSLFSFVFSVLLALAAAQAQPSTCECESPPCNAAFLGPGSMCECLFNAKLYCYRRNPQACPSPVPQGCGRAIATPVSVASGDATTSSFHPTYVPAGGLACVEVGYCSRPTKARTTMTVTNANGTAEVITIAAGVLGDAAAAAAAATPTPEPQGQSWPSWPGADPVADAPSWPNAGNQGQGAQPGDAPSWPNAGAPLQTVVPSW